MPRLPPDHICDLVRAVMPETSTEEELRDAQRQLDDYLDVIDRIHARLTREGYYSCDKPNSRDRVESFTNDS